MKLPDLSRTDDAGVVEYHGHADIVATAAEHARLRYLDVDLGSVTDRSTLFATLARGLRLPAHFGNNFDALADVLEDSDWLGSRGCAIHLGHVAHFRHGHASDWQTLEEILAEAASFWRERRLAFWVLVG